MRRFAAIARSHNSGNALAAEKEKFNEQRVKESLSKIKEYVENEETGEPVQPLRKQQYLVGYTAVPPAMMTEGTVWSPVTAFDGASLQGSAQGS